MALTRKFLESQGLNEAQVAAIIEAHTEVTDALKNERDGYKTKAEGIPALEADRDAWKKKAEANDPSQLRAEFDAYKAQVEADKLLGSKTTAMRGALKEAGVQREDFIELLLRAVDMEQVELDGDKIKDATALIDPLRQTYGGCFATTTTQGTPPTDPPSSGAKALTREQIAGMSEAEINANWSAVQAAIGQT